mgnify:CR=1 FL=1
MEPDPLTRAPGLGTREARPVRVGPSPPPPAGAYQVIALGGADLTSDLVHDPV